MLHSHRAIDVMQIVQEDLLLENSSQKGRQGKYVTSLSELTKKVNQIERAASIKLTSVLLPPPGRAVILGPWGECLGSEG